ncbi:hypothetical protein Tco_1019909 [Tanacetum coccineum]|uniref:Uncharacterized protein n=1 Tax=Tanacetum coccineum TaxID=301880 RepID=A0ABQ5FYY1_9ASTR
MPSFPSPEPTVSYFDDLDYFKDFEKEFLAIVYNDALTSKLDFLTEPTISPQHIDDFNLKDETSLSECDEEEQNILYFNDLFPFNVIYPDDSKSDKDNDDDKIDIKQSSGDLSIGGVNQSASISRMQYGVSLGLGYSVLTPCIDLAVKKSTNCNYGVFCEDMLKGAHFRALTKIFEDYLFPTQYAVSSKEDMAYQRLDFTRKHVCSIPNTSYPANYIRRIKLVKKSKILH